MSELFDSFILAKAKLGWREDGTPVAEVYDDIYFSTESGLEESRYVFLKNNNLPKLWIEEKFISQKDFFTIAELGFGSGLNFLATVDLFLKTAPSNLRLHYFAVDLAPFTKEDILRAISSWPELINLAHEFCANLPFAVPGFHRIELYNSRVFLTLAYGDVSLLLSQAQIEVDAWYLDGFAPAKNPDMWSMTVCQRIADFSRAGTRFATFSAARAVADGLSEVGFKVEKVAGFGRKRHMLRGVFQTGEEIKKESAPAKKHAVIIGAGLSGVFVASSLAKRGWEITLIDRGKGLSSGASGNHVGLVMPHLSLKLDFLCRFSLASYDYLQRVLKNLIEDEPKIGAKSGLLRLTTSKRLEKIYSAVQTGNYPKELVSALSNRAAKEVSEVEVEGESLFFPDAWYLSPKRFISAQLARFSEQIKVIFNTEIDELCFSNGCWDAFSSSQLIASAAVVVIASGADCANLPQVAHLPIERVRGQVLGIAQQEDLPHPKCPVCFDGYVAPFVEREMLVGATFDHCNESREIDSTQSLDLLRKLIMRVPSFAKFSESYLSSIITSARVSFRAMSPDRLPLIGSVANRERFLESYLNENEGRYGKVIPNGANFQGLYVSVGHGSHGLVTCPLSGEILASQICDEPSPIEVDLQNALHPSRFLIREIKRG